MASPKHSKLPWCDLNLLQGHDLSQSHTHRWASFKIRAFCLPGSEPWHRLSPADSRVRGFDRLRASGGILNSGHRITKELESCIPFHKGSSEDFKRKVLSYSQHKAMITSLIKSLLALKHHLLSVREARHHQNLIKPLISTCE